MTKSPERVWVVMDANGYCEYVTDNETDAAAAQRAWVSTVAMVIAEAMRHEQTRRLMAARGEG